MGELALKPWLFRIDAQPRHRRPSRPRPARALARFRARGRAGGDGRRRSRAGVRTPRGPARGVVGPRRAARAAARRAADARAGGTVTRGRRRAARGHAAGDQAARLPRPRQPRQGGGRARRGVPGHPRRPRRSARRAPPPQRARAPPRARLRACRSYRRQLHDVRRHVALVHPGPAILGLLGLAKLGSAGVMPGGSKTAAVLATATVAVTAGAAGVVLTQHRTLGAGEPAPRVVPGSKNIFSHKVVKGGRLPADTALVDATLRLPPVNASRSRSCGSPARRGTSASHLCPGMATARNRPTVARGSWTPNDPHDPGANGDGAQRPAAREAAAAPAQERRSAPAAAVSHLDQPPPPPPSKPPRTALPSVP